MRLGFVGVGRWAQKLAAAFRACGILAFTACLVSCDRNESATSEVAVEQKRAAGPDDGLRYFRDDATDVCFAFGMMIGRDGANAVMSSVPCSDKVTAKLGKKPDIFTAEFMW